jgi:hypothetical protein
MSGETKHRISCLEIENAELHRQLADRPTLRDQFAMVALNGVLTAIPFETEFNIKEITLSCYKVADAMMEVRDAKD